MNRHNLGRRDANEGMVVQLLLDAGMTVWRLDRNDPCDLLVGGNGHWWCVEVKSKTGKLTVDQRAFRSECRIGALPYYVVRDDEDVHDLIDKIKRGE